MSGSEAYFSIRRSHFRQAKPYYRQARVYVKFQFDIEAPRGSMRGACALGVPTRAAHSLRN